jgi:hypothetical protein
VEVAIGLTVLASERGDVFPGFKGETPRAKARVASELFPGLKARDSTLKPLIAMARSGRNFFVGAVFHLQRPK